MSAQVTKEDIQDLKTAVSGVNIELKHVNTALAEIKNRFNTLPCDSLTNEVKEVSVRFQMRSDMFERQMTEAFNSLNKSWEEIRKMQQDPPLKGEVEKLKEKAEKNQGAREARLYAIIMLLISLTFKFVV